MNIDIRVGSITNAQRGMRILRSKGYKANVRKLENPSPRDGCGYVLRVFADSDEPIKIIERNGIRVSGVDYP